MVASRHIPNYDDEITTGYESDNDALAGDNDLSDNEESLSDSDSLTMSDLEEALERPLFSQSGLTLIDIPGPDEITERNNEMTGLALTYHLQNSNSEFNTLELWDTHIEESMMAFTQFEKV
jgi:hypothetical protein